MAYGSTLAWLLFVMAFGVTLLLFWSARYWVYYPAGDDK
jgi:amino acid permease